MSENNSMVLLPKGPTAGNWEEIEIHGRIDTREKESLYELSQKISTR